MGGPNTAPMLLEDDSNEVKVPVQNETKEENSSETKALGEEFGE